jgi:hypothetical protein
MRVWKAINGITSDGTDPSTSAAGGGLGSIDSTGGAQ